MQAFKNYITSILNRINTLTGKLYKEDPAVFCWELANEATSTLDQTGEAVSPSSFSRAFLQLGLDIC